MLGDVSVDMDVSKVILSCDADVSGVWKSLSAEQKSRGVYLGEFLFSDPASPHSCSNPRGLAPRTQGGSLKDVHCTVVYSGKGLKSSPGFHTEGGNEHALYTST